MRSRLLTNVILAIVFGPVFQGLATAQTQFLVALNQTSTTTPRPHLASYRIQADGSLLRVGADVVLPPLDTPLIARGLWFNEAGDRLLVLVSSERSGIVSVYELRPNGDLVHMSRLDVSGDVWDIATERVDDSDLVYLVGRSSFGCTPRPVWSYRLRANGALELAYTYQDGVRDHFPILESDGSPEMRLATVRTPGTHSFCYIVGPNLGSHENFGFRIQREVARGRVDGRLGFIGEQGSPVGLSSMTPAFLRADPLGQFLYLADTEGAPLLGASLIDGELGILGPTQVSAPSAPEHHAVALALDPEGDFVAATYSNTVGTSHRSVSYRVERKTPPPAGPLVRRGNVTHDPRIPSASVMCRTGKALRFYVGLKPQGPSDGCIFKYTVGGDGEFQAEPPCAEAAGAPVALAVAPPRLP